MAVAVVRTVHDDVNAALRQIDEAVRCAEQMRGHLLLVRSSDPAGQAGLIEAAHRCGSIAAATLGHANTCIRGWAAPGATRGR